MDNLMMGAMLGNVAQGAESIGKSYMANENQKYLDMQARFNQALKDYDFTYQDGTPVNPVDITPELIKANPTIKATRKAQGISYLLRPKADKPGEYEPYDPATGLTITDTLTNKDKLASGVGSLQNKVAEATLETATPTQLLMAQGVLDGTQEIGKLPMRPDSPYNKGLIQALAVALAEKNKQSYSSYEGDVKAGMAKNLGYGKMGMNTLALNTGIGHADSAEQAYEAIKNTDINLVNKPLNWIRTNVANDPNVKKLEVSINALAGELATIFKGSSGTDQEIGKWLDVLNTDMTLDQAYGSIAQIKDLLRSRIGAVEYQQSNVMNQPTAQRQLISPKSEKIMKANEGSGIPINQTTPAVGQTFNGAKIISVEEVK